MRTEAEIDAWCRVELGPIAHHSALRLLEYKAPVDIDSFERGFEEWYGSDVPEGLFVELVYRYCKAPTPEELEDDDEDDEEMFCPGRE